ncbi:pre-toxin TG domain-containing protein [Paenibacillus sp. JSM ZJ436]|uniref:pre-toxin TG domain-containing protein n=1 Tax=Paenibacillus sp. JSM ZJ436 TaxID=3376190 RepID=UPI0037B1A888
MSRILVPPEVLLQVAEQFERGAHHLERMNKALNHSLSQMSEEWEGMTRERFYGDFHRAAREINQTLELMQQVHLELKRTAIKFKTLDSNLDPNGVNSLMLAKFEGMSAAGAEGLSAANAQSPDRTLLFVDKDGQTVAEFSSTSKLEDIIGEYREDEEGNVYFAGQNGSQLSVNTENLDQLLEQYKNLKEFFTRSEILYNPRRSAADFLQYAVDEGYDPVTFEWMGNSPNPDAQNVVDFNRMRGEVNYKYHYEPIHRKIRDTADTALNMIPFVGTAKGLIELYTGRSMITNEELSLMQKGFTVASMIPFAAAFRPMGKLSKGLGKGADIGDEAAQAGKPVDDVAEGRGKFNDPIKTKTNKGVEIEFDNPYGNKIMWVEQNPKNIPSAIESAKNSSNIGKAIEGKVGDYVQQKVDVIGFSLKLDNISTGKPSGDIDVMTHNQIIEIKKSMSAVKMDQIDKYVNPSNSQFFNFEGREIVLYIDEIIDISNPQTAKMIQEINSKGVKVVNSLEELGGVLK